MPWSYTLNLRHLAVFHAVAATGSLSRGAERLYITQPAVSRQIKMLEEALGLQLFNRESRGVSLTATGQTLAVYADRIFALSANAHALMDEIRSLKSGHLSLGASTTIGNYLLPPVLAHFKKLHPGIDIHLEIGNTDAIQRLLLEGRIDLGFTEGFVEHEELEANVFMHDELAIIAPPGHPLAENEGMADCSRLCQHTWVMREPGSGTQAVLTRIMRAHDADLLATFTLGSTQAVKEAVLAGAGIAGVSYLAVINEINAGMLVRIQCNDAAFQRPLHRLRHRNRQIGPATLSFLTLLMQTLATSDLLLANPEPVGLDAGTLAT